jgi:hypothetical protein
MGTKSDAELKQGLKSLKKLTAPAWRLISNLSDF